VNNFGQSKGFGTAQYPVHAQNTSGLMTRAEPLLTPEQLISRFLKGIPLTFVNGDSFSVDDLKDRVYLASNEAEVLLGLTITREQFKEKAPFDSSLFNQYVHTRTEHGPIVSVEEMAIVSANGERIYVVPPDWIEAANFNKRLINVIPLLGAYGFGQTTSSQGSNVGGLAFLSVLSGAGFVPAFFQTTYTAGLTSQEGKVPTPVNELIGTIAAIALLSEIAATNLLNSQSLSQDGISQSSSGPGPRIYVERISDLMAKRDELIKKLKGIFSSKFFVSNV
jgi:hypothetical protein